jgi:hypothetical protein
MEPLSRTLFLERGVLRKTFGNKRCQVVGDWRGLHHEKLHNFCCSLNVIGVVKSPRMRWAGHVECVGEKMNTCKILMAKPEGKGPLRGPRHRWKNNINMDLIYIICSGLDRINMAQDRNTWLAGCCDKLKNIWVPKNEEKILTSWESHLLKDYSTSS